MKRFAIIVALMIMSGICSSILGSSSPQYNVIHYDISKDLSNNIVSSIMQDRTGFIWIGTKNGLNRFDGVNFAKFYREDSQQSLRNSMICSLAEDACGDIWVGTDKGIDIYSPLADEFRPFDLRTPEGQNIAISVNRICSDKHNNMHIMAGPYYFRYDSEHDRLIMGNDRFAEYSTAGVGTIYADRHDGSVYVGLRDGVVLRYDVDNDRVMHIVTLPSQITAIAVCSNQELIVGTERDGVYVVNRISGTYTHPELDPLYDSGLYVRAICRAPDNIFWIGTENGIYLLSDGGVSHLKHDYNDVETISDNAIYSIVADTDGGMWIGSYFGGVDYIRPNTSPFRVITPLVDNDFKAGYRVRAFACMDGRLWVGTEDCGLNVYDIDSGAFRFRESPDVSFRNIQTLDADGDELWIGTFTKGVDVVNVKTGAHRHYHNTGLPMSLQNNDIFAICTDSRHTTWIGTTSGAFRFDCETDGFVPMEQLNSTFVGDILEDSEGNIWFGTYNRGALRYNPDDGTINEYRHNPADSTSLCYDRIVDVFEDSKRRLWFASEDGGFCRFNPDKDTFTRVSTRNGLPNNVVYKILEDNNHCLWLSTNRGLVCFDPDAMMIKAIYDPSNGLKSRQFNYNSGIKTPDGTLCFGSTDGFVAFNPDDIRPCDQEFVVIPTELRIMNIPVRGRTPEVLSCAMPYADTINLRHDQNTFSLSFSVFDYGSASNANVLHYRYYMEDIDKNPVYSTGAQLITFTDLAPGEYRFHIKYSPDGIVWPDNERILVINVIPAWWQTSLAWCLYIVAALGLVGVLVWLVIRRNNMKIEVQRKRQEQEQKEAMYNARLTFFTNIAHEIRTPLSLIKGPLSYLLHSRTSRQEFVDNLTIMEKNTDRLLNLVNQLLDFKKAEAGAFAVSMSVTNISDLVDSIIKRFVPAIEQRNLQFSLSLPENPVICKVDPEALTKVMGNLLSNALKFTRTYINVSLAIDPEAGVFRLSVANDGVPIPSDMREHIFEAFFQIRRSDGSHQIGSGIGLPLALSLVQLHNGRMYVDDKAEDTVFVVEIPMSNGEVLEIEGEKVMPDDDASLEIPDSGPTASMSDSATILVVEDNDSLRQFIVSQLSMHYRNVLEAADGKKALDILSGSLVHLIVTDVMMPEMDGLELCSVLKSDVKTSHIPVVLLTAHTTISNKIEGLRHGADAYIEKPFSVPHLLSQIENLLEGRLRLQRSFSNNPTVMVGTMAHNKADEAFLNKLTGIVLEEMGNSDLNIDELAERLNMSRSSFHRKIKGIADMTPGDFIRTIRLKRAAELLVEGEYNVTEICIMVGLNSLSYFSKSFQKQFGILPKDYARRNASGHK